MLLTAEGLYVFGPYRLDAHERQLLRNGESVPLPPRAFDLLLALVARAGTLATKEELLAEVWAGTFVEEANLSYTVSLLRKALGEECYIETVPKSGYRFIAAVSVVSAVPWDATSPAPSGAKTRKRWNTRWLAALTALGLLAVSAWVAWRHGFSRPPELITVPIASLGGLADGARLSPDGTQVAYRWDGRRIETDTQNWDVYVQAVEGGEPHRLTTDRVSEVAAAWSPDGKRIAFLRNVSPVSLGPATIYEIPASGGTERLLSPDGGFANASLGSLDWSPDGNSIVFTSIPDASGRKGLALLSLVSGRVTPLTAPPIGSSVDRLARFSPDGLRIAFLRVGIVAGNNGDLYTIPVGGGSERQVTFGGHGIRGHDWTVDGKELVFSSNRSGYWTLWRIAADGSEREPRQVTGIGTDVIAPSIAREGNRLAYHEVRADSDIWRVPVSLGEDGAAPSVGTTPVLVQGSTRLDGSPQASPDGTRLVFASQRSGDEGIWVSDIDGGRPLQIAAFQGYPSGAPRWSPKGTRVAFQASPSGHADIFIVGAQGIPQPVPLTTGPAENIVPSWSGDEKWIYFASNRTGRYEVWKAPVNAGGSPTQVTRDGGFAPVESSDGQFVYYLKGIESSSIWRVPVKGGEETFVVDGPTRTFWGYWALLRDGICFATGAGGRNVPASVHYFDFARKSTKLVGHLDAPAIQFTPGFSITPDGKSILYVKMKPSTSDIMLVKNFR